jgi:class 3 adenylate cyclase
VFPLWVKLGLLFGTLFGAATAGWGALTVQNHQQDEQDRLEAEMRTAAAALAAGIDGDTFASFQRESDRERPSFQAVVNQLHSVVEEAGAVSWAGTCRRDDRGTWHWVVEHTNENAYAVGFPIFDGEAERNQALTTGETVYVDVLEDETGRWRTVFAPIRTAGGRIVGLVELVDEADRDELIARNERRRILTQAGLATAIAIALSFLFGRVLAGNLAQLVSAARHVARGDYDVRVTVESNDELGLLADSFNTMVEGLAEREFIRDTFGRFVNPDVVAGILEDRALSLGGEAREVTVLMSDLRGFTQLSGELGPERMVALLNRYLSSMTDVVDAHGGNVAELLGDGMVILFGAPVARDDDPQRAVACALAMMEALERFNQSEDRQLQMGIGIHTDQVIAGTIGSPQHMKYGVVGDAINLAARLEAYTVGSEVLISAATASHLGDEVQLGEARSFVPKGRTEPLVSYPVRALGDVRAPVHQEARKPAELSATLYRVEGKAVSTEGQPVRITELGPTSVQLQGVELSAHDHVCLTIELPEQQLTGLYGTVASVTPAPVVQLTALSTAQQTALAEAVS